MVSNAFFLTPGPLTRELPRIAVVSQSQILSDGLTIVIGAGWERRKEEYEYYKQAGARFAHLSERAGEGSFLVRDVCAVGANSVVLSTSISPSARIGSHCWIEYGVTIGARAQIGNCVKICAGAIIGEGIRIGDGCVIDQGANVRTFVGENVLVVGNPGRFVRSIQRGKDG
jgi:acetyltransferase-like isoleucine patch superfamily enzyme